MMSNQDSILKGAGYMAKLKFYDCKGSGECIKSLSRKSN